MSNNNQQARTARQGLFVATSADLRESAFLDLSGANFMDNCETHQLTSINHLPPEILADIFLLCREGVVRKFDTPARPRRREVPLLLCQICRHWRQVALSLPFLWNSLAASGYGPFIPHPALIELWLSRSTGQPLSLHFALPLSSASRNDPCQYRSHASKIFGLFSKEMHRWRTISFILNHELILQFVGAVDSQARNLEELDLVFDGKVLARDAAKVSSLLPLFSNLRKLSWLGNLPAKSLRNIPFRQLTHIYMELFIDGGDVVECLSHCTSALEIHWKDVTCAHWYKAFGKGTQATLLSLQSLSLLGNGDLALILSRLTLPHLQDLHLHTGISSSTRDHRLLEDFLNRSSCPLNNFTFYDGSLDQESICDYLAIPFLESVPSIKIFYRNAETLLGDLKDPRYLSTFERLQVIYPSTACPAFTWK